MTSSAIIPIARATLLEALRSRLFWLAAALLLLGFGGSAFLQQIALIEGQQIQAAIIAALLRLCGVFLVISFVIASLTREFSDKVVELLLAQALPRYIFVLGKFAGFAAVALLIALLLAVPLAATQPLPAVALWTLSFFCELLIVAAVAMFCALTLNQTVGAMAAVFAFYLLARSLAAIQIIASANETAGWANRLADWSINGIALLLPRFDQMTQSAWLVDAPSNALMLIGVQTLLYVPLIIAATLFDFQRRNL